MGCCLTCGSWVLVFVLACITDVFRDGGSGLWLSGSQVLVE